MKFKTIYLSLCAALLSLTIPGYVLAQAKPMAQRNPLARLNRVLESAGAPALDSNQQQLKSLISDYRAAHPRGTPDAALQSARKELENAILAKDSAGVASAAGKISAEMSSRANVRIQELGKLEIQALTLLSNEQVSALKTQLGNAGLMRVLRLLTGQARPARMWFGARKG